MATYNQIDTRLAFTLQSKYLATRDDRDLGALFLELQHIATVITHTICRKGAANLSPGRREEVALDAAEYVIVRYIRDKDFYVHTSFLSTVRFACLHFLFNRQENKLEMHSADLDIYSLSLAYENIDPANIANIADLPEGDIDAHRLAASLACYDPELVDTFDNYPKGRNALEVIIHDEEWGKRIVTDMYLARTREQALVKVSKYKGVRWVIDNVQLLLHLYRRLRHPKGGKKWLQQVVSSGRSP